MYIIRIKVTNDDTTGPLREDAAVANLTSSRTSHESKIVEPRHLVLEISRVISKLCRAIFIVASRQDNFGAIHNITEGEYLEGDR